MLAANILGKGTLYIYRRGSLGDEEILYSLRSVARHLSWIRKVWIFGDRPEFLSADNPRIAHVPQEYVARCGAYRLPVVNLFLQTFLGSLLPEMEREFLAFSDDFVLLDDVSEEEMRRDRAIEDLARLGWRATGLWHDALWRTHDLLARFGYPRLNFESHVPAFLTKARVLEAYTEFRDFVTEDRFYGPLAYTTILNVALARDGADVVYLENERLRVGIYEPAELAAVETACQGRKFLNFEDEAWPGGLREFLRSRFPEPSEFEKEFEVPSSRFQVDEPAGLDTSDAELAPLANDNGPTVMLNTKN